MQEMDMLGYEILKSERSLIYILTLGVIQPYRNSGIGENLPVAWCQDMMSSRLSHFEEIVMEDIYTDQGGFVSE